jgi:hypothetical protein
MEHSIFISYRRADTSGHAGRLSDDLRQHFGRSVAFRDIDSIAAGADFVHALERAIDDARACIVLIGDTWLSARAADGSRRLDRIDDHVRREIELALDTPRLVILPVLVEGATMPSADELPDSLQRLARLQAVELSESRWDYDVSRLAAVLRDAGVAAPPSRSLPRWLVPLLTALLAAVIAVAVFHWLSDDDDVEAYTGLWFLPNGSFWTVREKDDGVLWIEETHYDSQQVWRHGRGRLEGDGLHAALKLVFEDTSFRYLHKLQVSSDGQSLIGAVRRSDREKGSSLVLTRQRP